MAIMNRFHVWTCKLVLAGHHKLPACFDEPFRNAVKMTAEPLYPPVAVFSGWGYNELTPEEIAAIERERPPSAVPQFNQEERDLIAFALGTYVGEQTRDQKSPEREAHEHRVMSKVREILRKLAV